MEDWWKAGGIKAENTQRVLLLVGRVSVATPVEGKGRGRSPDPSQGAMQCPLLEGNLMHGTMGTRRWDSLTGWGLLLHVCRRVATTLSLSVQYTSGLLWLFGAKTLSQILCEGLVLVCVALD